MDPKLFKDLCGMTVNEVIEVLQNLPDDVRNTPFHICGAEDAFLHVSVDPYRHQPIGVSLDYDSLNEQYENEDGEDMRGDWR